MVGDGAAPDEQHLLLDVCEHVTQADRELESAVLVRVRQVQ